MTTTERAATDLSGLTARRRQRGMEGPTDRSGLTALSGAPLRLRESSF